MDLGILHFLLNDRILNQMDQWRLGKIFKLKMSELLCLMQNQEDRLLDDSIPRMIILRLFLQIMV